MRIYNIRDICFKEINRKESKNKYMDEFEKHIELRKNVFSETYKRKSKMGKLYDDTLEKDEFDENSVIFNAYRDNSIIGTLRCVLDSPMGFPMEKEGNINCDLFRKKRKAMELGRFSIVREFKLNPSIFGGFMFCVHRFSIFNDIHFLVIDMPKHLLPIYKKIGFQEFGKPFKHFTGEVFYPGFYDIPNDILRVVKEVKDNTGKTFKHEMELTNMNDIIYKIMRLLYFIKIKFTDILGLKLYFP